MTLDFPVSRKTDASPSIKMIALHLNDRSLLFVLAPRRRLQILSQCGVCSRSSFDSAEHFHHPVPNYGLSLRCSPLLLHWAPSFLLIVCAVSWEGGMTLSRPPPPSPHDHSLFLSPTPSLLLPPPYFQLSAFVSHAAAVQ